MYLNDFLLDRIQTGKISSSLFLWSMESTSHLEYIINILVSNNTAVAELRLHAVQQLLDCLYWLV